MFFGRKGGKDGKKSGLTPAAAEEPDTKPPIRGPRAAPPQSPLSRRFQTEDDKPTRVLAESATPPLVAPPRPAAARPAPRDDAPTRIMGGGSPASADAGTATDPMADPPAGWLVVIDGPGKGNVATIRYGMNSIGRASTQRIPLDFGDARLSRENHAMVTYEPKSRRFYLQHGGGPNLTYVGQDPVLVPRELVAGDVIRLGDMSLRFFPLCSADFDWLG